MVDPASPYAARLQQALRRAGINTDDEKSAARWLAKALSVSYQAAMKALNGTTKALTAENNVRAARALGVDSEWLATGEGRPDHARPLFTPEVIAAMAAADPSVRLQAENAVRNVFRLEFIPHGSGELSANGARRAVPSAKAA